MTKNDHHKLIHSYITGFLLSVLLTLIAYNSVVIHMNYHHAALPHGLLIPLVLILATLQLFVQLRFFLHLGWSQSSRWNLVFFVSTASIIFLVVVASIWIMNNLNYNMMPEHVSEYIMDEEAIYKSNTPH